MGVSIEVRLRRLAPLHIGLGITTPKNVMKFQDKSRLAKIGGRKARECFTYHLPAYLPPHRYYIKAIVAGPDDLSFAARPFFVYPLNAVSLAACSGTLNLVDLGLRQEPLETTFVNCNQRLAASLATPSQRKQVPSSDQPLIKTPKPRTAEPWIAERHAKRIKPESDIRERLAQPTTRRLHQGLL